MYLRYVDCSAFLNSEKSHHHDADKEYFKYDTFITNYTDDLKNEDILINLHQSDCRRFQCQRLNTQLHIILHHSI